MKSKAYFQYYETFETILEKIKDEAARDHLRRLIINYGLYGTEPGNLSEIEDLAWTICRELIDQQQHRREVNTENASGPRKKPTAPRMKKPTVEEIAAYCKAKGYHINAEHFYSYYEANGWKVGRNAMKSWQATCANWATRDKANGTVWQTADSETAEYEGIL